MSPQGRCGGASEGPLLSRPPHLGLWYSGLRGSAGKVLKRASGRMVR
jgi:hypothetical protein